MEKRHKDGLGIGGKWEVMVKGNEYSRLREHLEQMHSGRRTQGICGKLLESRLANGGQVRRGHAFMQLSDTHNLLLQNAQ